MSNPCKFIMAIKRCPLRTAFWECIWTTSLIYSLRAEWTIKEKMERERERQKKVNNATLIAYELKTKVFFVAYELKTKLFFVATIFSVPIIRRHALKSKEIPKEPTVNKKLIVFLVSTIYRYGLSWRWCQPWLRLAERILVESYNDVQ